jgi:ribosomal protein S17
VWGLLVDEILDKYIFVSVYRNNLVNLYDKEVKYAYGTNVHSQAIVARGTQGP